MCHVAFQQWLRLDEEMNKENVEPVEPALDAEPDETDQIDPFTPFAVPLVDDTVPHSGPGASVATPSLASFDENGFGQLTTWIGKALMRLPVDMRRTLSLFHRAHPGPLLVGSACSGTDAPILVVKAYAEAVRTHLHLVLEVDHVFPGLP